MGPECSVISATVDIRLGYHLGISRAGWGGGGDLSWEDGTGDRLHRESDTELTLEGQTWVSQRKDSGKGLL